MLLTEARIADVRTRLLDFVRSRVRDANDAEDIVQDVLLRAYRKSADLSTDVMLVPWLYRIARNAVTDHYRRSAVRARREAPSTDVDEVAVATAWPEHVPESAYDALSGCVEPFILALPEPYGEAIRRTAFDGMSQVDLAAALDLSASGAKSRVQRARRMLEQQVRSCCQLAFDSRGSLSEAICRDEDPCSGSC